MMVNTALPERNTPQTVVALNIADLDKTRTQQQQQQEKTRPIKICRRMRRNTWTDIFIFLLVSAIIAVIELGIFPHTNLGFICKDPKISYPFRGDSISATCLFIGTLLVPLCIICFIEFIRENSFRRIRIGTIWKYYKDGLIGTMLVLLITEVMKVLVGEHRPHFFDSCAPDANQNCQPGTFILEYNCTNKGISQFFRTDIERSFPSGHTSISTFVSLYCAYLVQVRITDYVISKISKAFLIAVCLTWTCVCSLTRITDRRHHWWDVLAGACLGAIGAWYIASAMCHRENKSELVRTNTSTTLIDVKNKDATSVMI